MEPEEIKDADGNNDGEEIFGRMDGEEELREADQRHGVMMGEKSKSQVCMGNRKAKGSTLKSENPIQTRNLVETPQQQGDSWFDTTGITPGQAATSDIQRARVRRLCYTYKDAFNTSL
ncbi:hypothetical protein MKZ38_005909 [Zalerion maritima]|uniref:Uncharacterized protein n=1 Tax=Zalerion maritima TaxID=339359 RepID=A0AAD5RJH9_9PEZI|nr:hypothetical protein MKZ38_005909 [Zalerion maritima]